MQHLLDCESDDGVQPKESCADVAPKQEEMAEIIKKFIIIDI